MGGKARKRRQKNYERAHGSGSELPPPPTGKDSGVPRKLQTLMKIMEKNKQGKNSRNEDTSRKENTTKKRDVSSKQENATSNQENAVVAAAGAASKPKSNKRKRNAELEEFGESLKAEEVSRTSGKRKRYLKERKDKKKKKKLESEDTSLKQLYKHEDVKFGEVVDAPPKLPPIRKNKAGMGASQERLRVQAVEAYRQKRAWESRPGISLGNQAIA